MLYRLLYTLGFPNSTQSMDNFMWHIINSHSVYVFKELNLIGCYASYWCVIVKLTILVLIKNKFLNVFPCYKICKYDN